MLETDCINKIRWKVSGNVSEGDEGVVGVVSNNCGSHTRFDMLLKTRSSDPTDCVKFSSFGKDLNCIIFQDILHPCEKC